MDETTPMQLIPMICPHCNKMRYELIGCFKDTDVMLVRCLACGFLEYIGVTR